MDAFSTPSPPRAEPSLRLFALDRIAPIVQKAKRRTVLLSMMILLGMLMIACLVGVAVIPRFDRRVPLTEPQARFPAEGRAGPFRSA